jgi:hypothetical protein
MKKRIGKFFTMRVHYPDFGLGSGLSSSGDAALSPCGDKKSAA